MPATLFAQAYQRVDVESANPRHLVIMLFDAAVRYLHQAYAAMEAKDFERQNTTLCQAQAIFSELICSLDMTAGKIALDLQAFYTYIRSGLVEANLSDDTALLERMTGYAENLRDAWIEAERHVAEP
jgi:flagellar protein FliS